MPVAIKSILTWVYSLQRREAGDMKSTCFDMTSIELSSVTKDYHHEGKVRNLIGLVSDLRKRDAPWIWPTFCTGSAGGCHTLTRKTHKKGEIEEWCRDNDFSFEEMGDITSKLSLNRNGWKIRIGSRSKEWKSSRGTMCWEQKRNGQDSILWHNIIYRKCKETKNNELMGRKGSNAP